MSLAVSLIVLLASLAAAVARRPRLPGPAIAASGALVLLAAGVVGAHQAGHAIRQLGPTIGFLAALLVLADGCRREGLFDALGRLLAARSRADQRRLLALVFAAASAVTILLGLDATVVLLTPVVLVCAARLRAEPRAHELRLRASRQLRLAAAAGLQPHEPARVPGERAVVRAVRGADAAAHRVGGRGRLGRAAPARPGPGRTACAARPAADAPEADHPKGVPVIRAGRARPHPRRVPRELTDRGRPGVDRDRRSRADHAAGAAFAGADRARARRTPFSRDSSCSSSACR